MKGNVVGLAEIAGITLDAAVGDDFDCAESNAVIGEGLWVYAAVEQLRPEFVEERPEFEAEGDHAES